MLALAVAAVLVALLGAAEAAARLRERRLPPYRFWHDQLTTGKWHQLRALRREPPVDVVLAGSSQMLMALDPTAMPFRCYNAAFYRAVPTVMTEWLRDEVLPRLRPRLVVWGVSILDLNDNGPFHAGIHAKYTASPAREPGLRRWLLTHSALYRRRRRGSRGDDPTSGKPLDTLLGPMGKGLEYVHYDSYRLTDEKREFIETQIVASFAMGGRQVDALRDGARLIRATGARLLIVEVPCTEEFVAMYPNTDADLAEARRVLRGVAEELGVEFVQSSDDLPERWFADCVHLNGVGMREWTTLLAPVVEEALR